MLRPDCSTPPPGRRAEAISEERLMIFSMTWDTLQELHTVCLESGYTQVQFSDAINSVGYDPHRVAVYLQNYRINEDGPLQPRTQLSTESV